MVPACPGWVMGSKFEDFAILENMRFVELITHYLAGFSTMVNNVEHC